MAKLSLWIVFITLLVCRRTVFAQEFRPPGGPGPGGHNSPVNDETYLAWSDDAFNWTPEEKPVFEHASVPDVFVRSNGEFLLYWVDFSEMDSDRPGVEFLGFSTSRNGRDWEKRGRVTIEKMSGIKAVDPSVVEHSDGSLRLYYFDMPHGGRFEENHRIKSAFSRGDSARFTEEEGIRFEAPEITDPDVIQRNDGTRLMYLSRGMETMIAKSADGLNFEDTGIVVYEGGVPGAAVLEDGRIRLFVTSHGGIRSLISNDGISFTPEPGVRVSPVGSSPIAADPSVSRAKSGKWVMAFKVRPASF